MCGSAAQTADGGRPPSVLVLTDILPAEPGTVMSARALPWTRPKSRAGLSEAAQRRLWRQTAVAYLYLAPALVLLTLFHFLPAFYGFYISLWKWSIVKERFVDLQNYQNVLVDNVFWKSLAVTLWYVILVIPAEMVLGLVIAYLLFQ